MSMDVIYKPAEFLSEREKLIEFSESTENKLKSIYVHSSTVYEVFEYESSNSQKVWNQYLLDNNALAIEKNESVDDLLAKLRCAIGSVKANTINESIINDAEKAYLTYIDDIGNSPLNKFSICSINSLKQFVRYIPSFNNIYHNVYVDKDTGFFWCFTKEIKKFKAFTKFIATRKWRSNIFFH